LNVSAEHPTRRFRGRRDARRAVQALGRLAPQPFQSRLDRLSLTDQLGEKKNQEKELEAQLASVREQSARQANA
jgi:hypothetical protein